MEQRQQEPVQQPLPSELPEPYLKFGLICEKVLRENDGVVSLIRVVDRLNVTARGTGVPKQMPAVPFSLTVAMHWVGGLGKHEARINIIQPDGESRQTPPQPFFLDSLERGHNMFTTLNLRLTQEGLYWIEFLLNGSPRSRMPFRVFFQAIEVPKPPPQTSA